MDRATELKQHLTVIDSAIREAASACGRDPESIQLLAVSKTKPSSDIQMLHALGQRSFGENYVQGKDWKAVKAAKKEETNRRRKSIAMRLDSWRGERLKEAKAKVASMAQADEEARAREEDREAVLRYKKNMQLSKLQDDFTSNFVL